MNDEKLEQPLSEENTSAPEMPETVPEEVLPENELHPDTEQTEETIPDSTEEIPAIEPVQAASEENAVPQEAPVQNPQPQVQPQMPPQSAPRGIPQPGYPPYRQQMQYPYQNYAQYRYPQYSAPRQMQPGYPQQPYGQPRNTQQYGYGMYPPNQNMQNQPMQNPYSMPVQQQQQQTAPKKKAVPPLTAGQKKIVRLLWVCTGVLVAIFLYCIISDIVQYSGSSKGNASSEAGKSGDTVVMYQENKPDSAYEKNSDGSYSVADVAALVSPSITAIHVYADGEPNSSGSGIILSEDGYILTNAHVISEGDAFEVLIEEDIFEAELIGYDSKSDLAVLRADAEGLTPATLGNSDELVVGEEVVAIGSPAGLTGTVTNGIVSALNRQIRADQTGFYMDCIQTNAAISPGNSGGALVNMYGQVVGVTSSKYASLYGSTYEGLGFAISINQAMPIAEELIAQGYISGRVRIGITFVSMEAEEVAAEFSELYKLEETVPQKGVWIQEISEDCDIAKSGLEINDLILSVEGKEVNNYDELCAAIEGIGAGVPLEAECRRYSEDGTYEDFTISFEMMEDTSGDY